IAAKTVIWAAGVTGALPPGIDKTSIVRGNRLIVDRYSRVQGSTNIYAIGDIAYMETPKYPKGHPQLAATAIQQATVLAKNLKKILRKDTGLKEFEYLDKGTMATVGRNLAVCDIPKPKLHFGGFIAWII